MSYQRIEVLAGTERRRTYTPEEKARMVGEAFRPGVMVAEVARRLGVHESLLYRWRRLMKATAPMAAPSGFVAVTIASEPVSSDVPAALRPPRSPSMPAATPVGVLELALPGGARLRLEGPVDPALAAAVLGALA